MHFVFHTGSFTMGFNPEMKFFRERCFSRAGLSKKYYNHE